MIVNKKKELSMSMRKVLKLAILVCLAAIILPTSSNATMLTVDEIIYETGVNPTDPDVLGGTVEMTFNSSTLEITLTNTSTGVASLEASYNLLTGLGFNLPGTLSIASGSVSMAGSAAINFTILVGNDVSGEWGYDNDSLNAGPFQNPPAGETYSTVNTVVSSMESSSKDGVFGTSLFKPDNTLNGPEFGLLSNNVNSSVAGGLYAIQDSIILSLTLGGSWSGTDLISFIDDGDVVLSFGSPNASVVPEPATMLLFGSGLAGLFGFRKKFRKR